MLAALCQRLYARYPFAKIVVPPNAEYRLRAVLGTYQLGSVQKFGFDFGLLLKLIPGRMRNLFGIVMPSEVDVIIDASGFAYGDQWGKDKAEKRLGGNIIQFKAKRKHRKVILMPQAMGPFTDRPLIEQMQVIFENADLVFARDPISLSHAQAIYPGNSIRMSPDFTNLLETTHQIPHEIPEDAVCVIPNKKMLQMKAGNDPTPYLSFMATLINVAVGLGQNCYILIHEGIGDINLAKAIISQAEVDVEIIELSSSTDIKTAIGFAKVVISSRFHGLVSALSQGIPVIATGWSHKYQLLLQDYGVEDFLFDESSEHERAVLALRSLLTDSEQHRSVKINITSGAKEQKRLAEKMWLDIFPVLDDAIRE